MNATTLEYPDSWLVPMATDALQFAKDAKMAAAVKLFEVGKLTSGQAAQFVDVERQEFLLGCRQWGVDSVKTKGQAFSQSLILPFLPCPGRSSS